MATVGKFLEKKNKSIRIPPGVFFFVEKRGIKKSTTSVTGEGVSYKSSPVGRVDD